MPRTVTLCSEDGVPTGTADLLEAHLGSGKLHIAFSVYVFNLDRTKLLIQRRSSEKMLWPGIWANTCCSHPFEQESAVEAGERRLEEELGFTTDLEPQGSFVYHAEDPNGKGSEYEHVTLLVGEVSEDEAIAADPKEVMEWKWIAVDELQADMANNPLLYSPWLHQGLSTLIS